MECYAAIEKMALLGELIQNNLQDRMQIMLYVPINAQGREKWVSVCSCPGTHIPRKECKR